MHKNQNKAIMVGIFAGVFWGTPFLVPSVLLGFNSLEITFGRFLCFGLISLLNIKRVTALFKQLTTQNLIRIIVLSATGFWLYSFVLFAGIKLSNGVIATLIIGCLPITITLMSKPRFNLKLIIGLLFFIIGILSLLVYPILRSELLNSVMHINWGGTILIILALLMWTWFGIYNSRFMANNQQIKSVDYSSLLGIISMLCMIILFLVYGGIGKLFHHSQLGSYVFWSMILGVGASWIASILWAYSSKYCPSSIGGTLIISETIFGLIYSFLFEQRLPQIHETVAIISLIISIVLVIKSQRNFM